MIKIGFLQKCFERLPELVSRKAPSLALLSAADELNEVRNTIVHGALSHYIAEPEPALVLFGSAIPSQSKSILCGTKR